jgi:hypothetical protein
MIDAVFVGSLGAAFFVQDLCQFAPFLSVLIPVVRNHDAVLFCGEIVLRRLIVKRKDTLSWFTLKIGIDEIASLRFGVTKLQWQVGFSFWIGHASLWLAILLSHPFFFSSLK